jgi:lysophospholipase L1-like esterase
MFLALAVGSLLSAQPAPSIKPFEFRDGDRIVWLGNTLVEREQRYGHWETALLTAYPEKNLTVRNLGWSGDTVFGEARAGFDNADKGLERLVSLTLELKPTVIFISYGTNEAFEGSKGIAKFEKGMDRLLDALKPADARIVLFTPLPFQRTKQTPDVKERNQTIAEYADAIRGIATKRHLYLADCARDIGTPLSRLQLESTSSMSHTDAPEQLAVTLNGMHLTDMGYFLTRGGFLKSLGATAVSTSPETRELLRAAVMAKNEQFFNKWRPQNETYLFGFRKHEQGKNAKEIAEFDPFIAKAEIEIARIRKSIK